VFSLRCRRRIVVEPIERLLSRRPRSRQRYPHRAVSAYFRVNGHPPPAPSYDRAVVEGFAQFRLDVGGLVKNPVSLTLTDLRELGYRCQTTEHNCIQGWTGVAEWGGVPLGRVIDLVRPTAAARYAVFYAMDDKGLTEGEGRYGFFYETLPLDLLTDDAQCLLAMDMNGAPLPVEHGAPLRLRAETQLGYKMVKWITSIELVDDVAHVGLGQGGWREDHQYYAARAGI
jgi:DMSO/TMAO reductase YedYZ molybdopterin-dependent catalytic subunit